MPPTHVNPQSQRGFTLIEMLIVAPLIILLIAGIIAFITALTGDSLKMKEKNASSYTIQEALSRLEEDASRSTGFLTTTGNVTSPQGKDDTGAAFTYATDSTLILQAPATTESPFNTARQIVYTKNPDNTCANKTSNDVAYYSTVYFLKGTDLWRRVIINRSTTDKCNTPWQRPTCLANNLPASITPTSTCQAKDEKILTNVTAFSTTYYQGDTALASNPAISDASTPISANSIGVSLTTSQNIANETIETKGSLRITSVNR